MSGLNVQIRRMDYVLNSLHDKAFDRGLITLDKNYKIIVSKKLKDTEMDLETKTGLWDMLITKLFYQINFCPEKFIEYHNDVIFFRGENVDNLTLEQRRKKYAKIYARIIQKSKRFLEKLCGIKGIVTEKISRIYLENGHCNHKI